MTECPYKTEPNDWVCKPVKEAKARIKELEEAIDAQCCTCFHRTRCGLAKKIEHLEAELKVKENVIRVLQKEIEGA